MKIEWITQDKNNSAVTIYDNNITLSKQAANYFDNAYGVAVGFDTETKQLVMKKITKEEVLNKDIDKEDIYALSMKPSFGRINSKKMVVELSKYLDLNFLEKKSYKFTAKWNTGLKMLIIDTKEVSKDA